MNYTKEVFKMLGLEPYRVFREKDARFSALFRLTDELEVEMCEKSGEWKILDPSIATVRSILCGDFEIDLAPVLTEEDKVVLRYAQLCGCHYVTKDVGGCVAMHKIKPTKHHECWNAADGQSFVLHFPLSCVREDDEEPLYIEDALSYSARDEVDSEECVYVGGEKITSLEQACKWLQWAWNDKSVNIWYENFQGYEAVHVNSVDDTETPIDFSITSLDEFAKIILTGPPLSPEC